MPTTVFDITATLIGTDDTGGNGTLSLRQSIPASRLSAATGNQLRVTIRWGTSNAGSPNPGMDEMWAGQGGTRSDINHNPFTGTQVQVLFGGASPIPFGGVAGQEVVSDWTTLGEAFDNTKSYVFAFYCNASCPTGLSVATLVGDNLNWQGSNVTSQTDPFFNGSADDNHIFIEKIEIQSTVGSDTLLSQIWM